MQKCFWVGPLKMDSELRQFGFRFLFKLMRRAVAQGGVAKVEVEVCIEAMSHFQVGFSKRGECGAVGKQFGFERALAVVGFIMGDTGYLAGWRRAKACCKASSAS